MSEAWHHYRKSWDFQAFVLAGRAASAGANPYETGYDPNMNAPASLLVFEWLAPIEIAPAFLAWQAISLALYGLMLVALLRAYPGRLPPLRVFWLTSLTSLWHGVMLGQIYTAMGVVIVGAWLLLRADRRLAAGLLIGALVSIKPTFALWVGTLLLAGHHRAGLSALAAAVGFGMLPVLRYGPEAYVHWVGAIPKIGPGIGMPTNASLMAVAARWQVPWLGYILAALLLAGVAAWAWRARPTALQASAVALAAMVLVGPIGWVDYALWLLPIFAAYPWSPRLRAAATILVIPTQVIWGVAAISPMLLGLAGLVYPLAFLLLLSEAITRRPPTPDAVDSQCARRYSLTTERRASSRVS